MKSYISLFLAVWIIYSPAVLWALPPNVFFRRTTAATPSPSGYIPYVATFDGTDYLRFIGPLAGSPSGSTTLTFSAWVKFNGGDGVLQSIFTIIASDTTTTKLRIQRTAANTIEVIGFNIGSTERLKIATTNTVTASSGWTHLMIVVNLAQTAQRKIYINGVASPLTVTTYTNSSVSLAATGYRNTIGANGQNVAGTLINGSLSDVWFAATYLDDLTKFRSNDGKPVNLGETGQLPTGSPPIIYFSGNGNGNTWTNWAGGSAFTINGTLGTETAP